MTHQLTNIEDNVVSSDIFGIIKIENYDNHALIDTLMITDKSFLVHISSFNFLLSVMTDYFIYRLINRHFV